MDLKKLFKDFNASKFLFFGCLLPLSILLSLKLNGDINWSVWIIFTPLWFLNIVTILGALVGSFIWCRHPEYRNDREPYTDYKAMLITLVIHLLLIMFEILLCDNITHDGRNKWSLVFTPLFFAFPISLGACIWGIRNDRSLELELILSANILFFIFTALRLDQVFLWPWSIVFIPLWIVMSLFCIFTLYYFLLAIIFFRSNFPESDQRNHLYMTVIWILIVVPLLTFQILLVRKLDGSGSHSWPAIFIPLHISLLSLIFDAFGNRNGNRWWFGLRIDFCQFLLEHCPCLRIYGNISFNFPVEEEGMSAQESEAPATDLHISGSSRKGGWPSITVTSKYDPVVSIQSIETPD